jgi:hypothetical protein
MFLNLLLIADIIVINHKQQVIVDEALHRANMRQRVHDYQINEQVLVNILDADKLDPKYKGPYPITAVHANGTVDIQLQPDT